MRYIPALNRDWLTPLYDPVVRLVMNERRSKGLLVAGMALDPGQRVLDLGCGTATLSVQIKRRQPAADVVGLDGDPRILSIARKKAARQHADVRFDQGLAFALPYVDGNFDHVVSSLLFHHLVRDDKRRTASEIFRVLRPGGYAHIIDFAPPDAWVSRAMGYVIRRFEEVADNIDGMLPVFFSDAGFYALREEARFVTLLGPLALYRTSKPPAVSMPRRQSPLSSRAAP